MAKTFAFYPGCTHQNVCVRPIYEELLIEDKTSLTGSKCHRRVNDVYLLLNQDRLDRQTQEQLIDRIEKQAQPGMLAQLRNKYTDEELCKRVKSRYIQSKAELQSYMQHLMYQSDYEKTESEYKKMLDDDKKKYDDDDKNKEPTKTE